MITNLGLKSVSIMDPPETITNAIWFADARSTQYTRCIQCPSANVRCQTCSKKFNAEVFLLQLSDDETKGLIGKMSEVAVTSFSEALNLIGIQANFEIFNENRIRYLESKYEIHIHMYRRDQDKDTQAVREPRKVKFQRFLKLMLKDNLPVSGHGLIENFSVIQNAKILPTVYVCRQLKDCKFSTTKKSNFDRHEKSCIKHNTKRITCKQKTYGGSAGVIVDMVNESILPEEALTYRNKFLATFDLETIENKFDNCAPEHGLVTEANLLLLSIAVGSNMDGYEPKCWVRKTSDTKEETRLVKAFIQELTYLWVEKQKQLPAWIGKGYIKLDYMQYQLKLRNAPWYEYQRIWAYKTALKKFTVLDIFGFNSGKFDLPCIAAPLLTELKELFQKVSILKKMSSYFLISTEKFLFKDVLRFTAPCSYDKFVSVWGASGSKSIWPYSYYNSVEEIKLDKKFPPRKAFESNLRGYAKPEMKTYIIAKTEFYRRKLLPIGHPDRIVSMFGFLRYYNKQDVQPLALALQNCFDCYHSYFGVNALTGMSLPSLAHEAMFKNYKKDAPLIYSFSEAQKEVNNLFRRNILGGLVNVYRRHVRTYDSDDQIPFAARYSGNGDPFTSIISLDFTSMYLSCQNQKMPTSPGINWQQTKKTYKKNIMCAGHSFKAQQWLCYRQATGYFVILTINFVYLY